MGGGVEGFAGVAEEERVRAGGEVAEGVVDEVGGGGSEDVADCAEVVGQGPEDVGGGGIGKEFVLGVRCPEVVVGDGWTDGVGQVSVVELDGGLIGFGDENGFGIGGTIAVCVEGLTNPDVVVVVGIFYNLNRGPSGGCRIVGLFRDRG